MSNVKDLFSSMDTTATRNGRNIKIAWTVVFVLASSGLTVHATNSWSAGGAVLFGLWAIGGFIEINH